MTENTYPNRNTMTLSTVDKSNNYGYFFCQNKGDRLKRVLYNIVYNTTNDPLYVKLYNDYTKKIESLSLTVIIRELIFNSFDPFPPKSPNNSQQVHLAGNYFVSSLIYSLLRDCWQDMMNPNYYNLDMTTISNNDYYIQTGYVNTDEAYNSPNITNQEPTGYSQQIDTGITGVCSSNLCSDVSIY